MIDFFPKNIGSKQFEWPSYPTRPFYILDINEKEIIKHIRQSHIDERLSEQEIRFLYNQHKDRILGSCPLRFVIERPDFVEEKDYLRIESVDDKEFNALPPDFFKLSPYSLKETDSYWLDSGIINV